MLNLTVFNVKFYNELNMLCFPQTWWPSAKAHAHWQGYKMVMVNDT